MQIFWHSSQQDAEFSTALNYFHNNLFVLFKFNKFLRNNHNEN